MTGRSSGSTRFCIWQKRLDRTPYALSVHPFLPTPNRGCRPRGRSRQGEGRTRYVLPTFHSSIPSNRHHPVREMVPSTGALFSRTEKAGDKGIEARRGGGYLRGERGDCISRAAFPSQRLAVRQCITGAGRHERVGIGVHRVNGVSIVIEGETPCSARSARIRLRCGPTLNRQNGPFAGILLVPASAPSFV